MHNKILYINKIVSGGIKMMNTSRVHKLVIEEKVQRNSYLIFDSEEIILIDPGSYFHADKLIEELTKLTQVKNITMLIFQSIDYLNFSGLERLFLEGFKGKIIIPNVDTDYVKKLVKFPVNTIADEKYKVPLKSGETLEFISTPFLPYAGCFVTYYSFKQSLFSNHLLSHHSSTPLNLQELIQSINSFHETILPSCEFVRHNIKKIKKYPFQWAYPRLGHIIKKDKLSPVLNGVLRHDFFNTQQVVEKINEKNVAYNYVMICNHMLKRLENTYPFEELIDIFEGSKIILTKNPPLEIEKTSLKGYRLWNGFFDLIYYKKGLEWLSLLEPLVKKYTKLYHIKAPLIYKLHSVNQQKKIKQLHDEKYLLEKRVKDLTSQIDQTLDKLLRCPITNLYNERVLIEHLRNHLDDRIKDEHSRVLIVVYIDNLYHINKKYGPEKGDETLKNLVYILENTLDNSMLLFKQNGPAIFIYAHAMHQQKIKETVLKVRNSVKDSDIFIEDITVSLSVINKDELNPQQDIKLRAQRMIELALLRLERAKNKGKGQVLDKDTDKDEVIEGAILLIDEDETNQNLMLKIFKRIGYEVVIAKDIYDAYSILKQREIDVIVSEINLSKLDGFQFKQRLNATQHYKNIPFIIMSHHKTLDVVMRCNMLDVDLILQKPIIPEELIGHVERIRSKRGVL